MYKMQIIKTRRNISNAKERKNKAVMENKAYRSREIPMKKRMGD